MDAISRPVQGISGERSCYTFGNSKMMIQAIRYTTNVEVPWCSEECSWIIWQVGGGGMFATLTGYVVVHGD